MATISYWLYLDNWIGSNNVNLPIENVWIALVTYIQLTKLLNYNQLSESIVIRIEYENILYYVLTKLGVGCKVCSVWTFFCLNVVWLKICNLSKLLGIRGDMTEILWHSLSW